MDVKDRIKLVMDSQKMSQQEFAQVLGITPGSLSGILNERTKPTNNHTSAIHRAFPNINIYWLMFGEGEMYNSNQGQNAVPNLDLNNAPESAEFLSSDGSPSLFGEAGVLPFAGGVPGGSDFTEQNAVGSTPSTPVYAQNAAAPNERMQRAMGLVQGAKTAPVVETKIVKERVVRKVKEIRVFYDDGTYESFTPSN